MLAVEQAVGCKMNDAIRGQFGTDGRGACSAKVSGLKSL